MSAYVCMCMCVYVYVCVGVRVRVCVCACVCVCVKHWSKRVRWLEERVLKVISIDLCRAFLSKAQGILSPKASGHAREPWWHLMFVL